MTEGQKSRYAKGIWAEKLCVLFLQGKGYRILATRYKTRFGEIDIIAQKDDAVAFVEVKSRKGEEDALYAVTPRNRKRVINAARHFLAKRPEFSALTLRFDVMVLTSLGTPRHILSAWQVSDSDADVSGE